MTIHVVGPVNGDLLTLTNVIESLKLNEQDKVWFVGNVISPACTDFSVLDFIKLLGKQAIMILGRNEIQFLSEAESVAPSEYADLIQHEDAKEWAKWLAKRPFVHHDGEYTLVHAGIPAEWSLSQLRTFAIEAESSLSMGSRKTFFENVLVGGQSRWHAKLRGWKRTRYIVNALTNLSYLDEKGRADFTIDPSKDEIPEGETPWYLQEERMMVSHKVITAYALKPETLIPSNIIALTGSDASEKLRIVTLAASPQYQTFERLDGVLSGEALV